MASEKFGQLSGSQSELTEFPLTYVQLNEKVEAIKEVYDALYKVNKQSLRSDNYGTSRQPATLSLSLSNPL